MGKQRLSLVAIHARLSRIGAAFPVSTTQLQGVL